MLIECERMEYEASSSTNTYVGAAVGSLEGASVVIMLPVLSLVGNGVGVKTGSLAIIEYDALMLNENDPDPSIRFFVGLGVG